MSVEHAVRSINNGSFRATFWSLFGLHLQASMCPFKEPCWYSSWSAKMAAWRDQKPPLEMEPERDPKLMTRLELYVKVRKEYSRRPISALLARLRHHLRRARNGTHKSQSM